MDAAEEEVPVPVAAPVPVVEAVEVARAVLPVALVEEVVAVRPPTEAAHLAEALGCHHPTAAAGMIPTLLRRAGSLASSVVRRVAPQVATVVNRMEGRAGPLDAKTPKPKKKTPETKKFGNNRYYAGGARTPYASGTRSPLGLTPFLLPVAALAFFPGIWLFGAYSYPYTHPYYYTDNNNRNQSLPVTCLCEQYQECGCDDTNNSTYYESLFNGTQPRNTSNVQVVNVNGTKTIVINGTLPNGTTADDGTSSSTSSSTSGAASGPLVTLVNASGYWVMVAVVIATVWSI